MKRPRGIRLILLISACFFLCIACDAFALFRDDVSVEEAEEWVSSERERSRIELKKRQQESKEEIFRCVLAMRLCIRMGIFSSEM